MSQPSPYDSAFFEGQREGSYGSARAVVPRILDVSGARSVVDFGCGIGTWLRAFEDLGLTDLTGVDGDYVDQSMLVIPSERFVRADLTKPVTLGRTYDLVVSLEVAEHLDASCARAFVKTLTSCGSMVLFSAAIPHQGGNNHVNEQWPQYWNEFFSDNGFVCFDLLRQMFWNDTRVDWWYRQNMLLFVHASRAREFEESTGCSPGDPLALVHPERYLGCLTEDRHYGIRGLIKKVPDSIRTSLRWSASAKRA